MNKRMARAADECDATTCIDIPDHSQDNRRWQLRGEMPTNATLVVSVLALERDVDEWTQAPRSTRDHPKIAPR